VKTKKDVNHSAVCNTKVIIDGIKLSVKRHVSSALIAFWDFCTLKKSRFTAKLMPIANLWSRPLEFRQ
jgi:hypothetical protein